MVKPLRVVCYVNQFFGQLGGEDKAGVGPEVAEGAVGAARAVQQALGEAGTVVATLICGDNYAAEQGERAVAEMLPLVAAARPDLVIAGPAFLAGRYGVACGALCAAVQARLGIPAVTGMHAENPGVELHRRQVYVVPTGAEATRMLDEARRLVALGLKLARGEAIGAPAGEGYFARGVTRNVVAPATAAERATAMLLDKLGGRPFASEVPRPAFPPIVAPKLIKTLAGATIALVTDGGLVPRGNPDGIEALNATRYGAYSIEGKAGLEAAEYDNPHRGYDTSWVKQDPHRLVPVDVARELEQSGAIGKLHETVYSTVGVATTLAQSARMGAEIADKLRAAGVDAVILTSTWGTSTRCGAAIARELERAGLPTVQVSTMTPVAVMVGANRIVQAAGIIHPLGNADLSPEDEKALRRRIVEHALQALRTEVAKPTVFTRE